MKNRRQFLKESLFTGISMTVGLSRSFAGSFNNKARVLKIGVIGLDTSHSPAFAKYINDPEKTSMQGVRVTAAYPYGSSRIETSASRIPEYTSQFREMDIPIVDSIEELLKKTDCILLETNDGTIHYKQVLEVFKANKPVFIDKPVAANLIDTIKIYEAAKKYKVPMFSASSLRYLKKAQEVRHNHAVGDVLGASTFSPEEWEPSHTDLYWYGIHGVEILYTIMGTGCKRIKRVLTDSTDIVVGEWDDGRVGTFRGDRHKVQHYGGTAFGSRGIMEVGPFDGYDALIEKIIQFFKTGISPIDDAETIELYTFMQAADVSKEHNGDWVELEPVYEAAYKKANN